jgi:hypothetical protein
MSAVIEFPAGRTRPATPVSAAGPAEILIFPGVRIERASFDLGERLPILRNAAPAQVQPKDFDFY